MENIFSICISMFAFTITILVKDNEISDGPPRFKIVHERSLMRGYKVPVIDEINLMSITKDLQGDRFTCKIVGVPSHGHGLQSVSDVHCTLGDYSNCPTLDLDSLANALSYSCSVDTERKEFIVSREGSEDWIFKYSSQIPYLLALVEAKPNLQPQYTAETAPKVLTPETMMALRDSFKGALTPKGQSALSALKKFIMDTRTSMNSIYSPITFVAQSSGMGKSKLAYELLKEMPGIYFVFRGEKDTGFPEMNPWSEAMMMSWSLASNDFDLSATSNLGRFLRYLKLVVDVYISRIEDACKPPDSNVTGVRTRRLTRSKSSFEAIASEAQAQALWSQPPETSRASSHPASNVQYEYPSAKSTCNDSIEDIAKSINKAVDTFYENRDINKEFPFLLVFDELSLLSSPRLHRASAFRIVRRALSCLGNSTRIFALALGTNTDILEFHPGVSFNSSRAVSRTEQIRPFIPVLNSDVLWGYADRDKPERQRYHLHKIVADEFLLLNRRHSRLLASLGRPLWSSVPLDTILALGEEKLRNGHLKTGEPYLAIWAIRAGVYIISAHKVVRLMVQSIMATCYFASADGSELWIGYPSDPVLAYAASALTILEPNKIDLFDNLVKFFDSGAVHTGRLGESVASMLILLAMDESRKRAPLELKYDNNVNGLHDLNDLRRCKIFADAEPKGNAQLTEPNCLDKLMNVQTVESFLTSLYGASVVANLKKQAGPMENVLGALMNMTHIVPLSRQWCKEDSENVHSLPKNMEKDFIASVVDDDILNFGLMRNAGIMMPTNYYGIDVIIPIYMVTKKTRGYIGVQYKTEPDPYSKNEVLDMMAKMLPGDHYVTCATCNSPNENCPSCSEGKTRLANISECVLVIIMTIGSKLGSRSGPIFADGEYLNKADGVYMCQAKHKVKGVMNNVVGISSFGTSFMSFLPEQVKETIVNVFTGRNIFNSLESRPDRLHVAQAMRQAPLQYPDAYDELYRSRQSHAKALSRMQVSNPVPEAARGQEGAVGSKRLLEQAKEKQKKRKT